MKYQFEPRVGEWVFLPVKTDYATGKQTLGKGKLESREDKRGDQCYVFKAVRYHNLWVVAEDIERRGIFCYCYEKKLPPPDKLIGFSIRQIITPKDPEKKQWVTLICDPIVGSHENDLFPQFLSREERYEAGITFLASAIKEDSKKISEILIQSGFLMSDNQFIKFMDDVITARSLNGPKASVTTSLVLRAVDYLRHAEKTFISMLSVERTPENRQNLETFDEAISVIRSTLEKQYSNLLPRRDERKEIPVIHEEVEEEADSEESTEEFSNEEVSNEIDSVV